MILLGIVQQRLTSLLLLFCKVACAQSSRRLVLNFAPTRRSNNTRLVCTRSGGQCGLVMALLLPLWWVLVDKNYLRQLVCHFQSLELCRIDQLRPGLDHILEIGLS